MPAQHWVAYSKRCPVLRPASLSRGPLLSSGVWTCTDILFMSSHSMGRVLFNCSSEISVYGLELITICLGIKLLEFLRWLWSSFSWIFCRSTTTPAEQAKDGAVILWSSVVDSMSGEQAEHMRWGATEFQLIKSYTSWTDGCVRAWRRQSEGKPTFWDWMYI